MADSKFTAGLTDPDELSGFPSAASPLPEGMDLDVLRANPEMLAHVVGGGQQAPEAQAPSRSAAAAGAFGDAAATAPPDFEQEGQAGDLRTAQSSEDLAKQMGTVPDSIQAAQSERDAAAARQVDPSQYKPSTGTRVWRGVRGGLTGLLTSGIRGGLLGAVDPELEGSKAYGAPTDAYDAAVEGNAKDVQGKQQKVQELLDNFKLAQDARDKSAGVLKDSGAGYGRVATTANAAKNAATDATKATTEQQRVDQESPASKVKLDQAQLDQRKKQIESDPMLQKLSPLNKIMYILNNRVPDPKQPTEGEINAVATARALTVYNLKRGKPANTPPETLEDFSNIEAAGRGQLVKVEQSANKEADANLRTASQIAGKRLKELQKLQSDTLGPANKLKFQDQIDDAQEEYDDLQGKLTSAPSAAATTAPDPKGHLFDSAAWLAANPKGDVEAAKAEAKKQGYAVR